jgi:UDP-glucuronate decarboxylase
MKYPKNGKTVLVAGAAGFIGSHLCIRLLEDGYDVIGLDNLYTGDRSNLEYCFGKDSFIFQHHDVSNKYECYLPLDFIFHLASPASPKWYQKDPIGTIKANVLGSFNLLELAKIHKCGILFSSTSEIYGDPLEHPQKESYNGNVNCNGPRACYDEAKRCSETIFNEYNKVYGVDTKIARFFNTYGTQMALDDGRVISNFIVKALKNEDLVINGDGKQTRSFQYEEDLINALIKFMNSSESGPMNLGNPEEYTILELAEKIIKRTNSSSKIVFQDKLQDDPILRKPDISLAYSKLDWYPMTSLDRGLDITIGYFKRKLNLNPEQCEQKCY